ncbi:MAG: hypothetical protein R2769_06065 [Saprospiraceae bacterium]
MKFLKITFLLSILALASCGKETLTTISDEQFVFAVYYGECQGNCFTGFKMQEGEIFPDIEDFGYQEEYDFSTTPLSQEEYELASELLDEFPKELLDSRKDTYGCPDCTDQGVVYLELQTKNGIRKWMLDTFDEDQSQEIIDFKDKVLKTIQDLK